MEYLIFYLRFLQHHYVSKCIILSYQLVPHSLLLKAYQSISYIPITLPLFSHPEKHHKKNLLLSQFLLYHYPLALLAFLFSPQDLQYAMYYRLLRYFTYYSFSTIPYESSKIKDIFTFFCENVTIQILDDYHAQRYFCLARSFLIYFLFQNIA